MTDFETDEFARLVLSEVPEVPPTGPRAFYNEDGDCIEFFMSNESFYAERIDKLVTVYYGRDSGEIVGSLIKGVRRFIKEITESCPGFMIEVQDGRVRLGHIFTAGMWRQGEPMRVMKYKKLRDSADQLNIEVELPALS